MFKALVFSIVFCTLGLGSLSSQVFSEDFNSGTALNSWTLIDADGRNAALSRFTDAWILSRDSSFTDSCASSTSYYIPLGQADDWMISPAIQLGSNNVLWWDGMVQDNRFPDGYEVRISTTTPDTAAFFNNPPVFTVAAENPAWTRRDVNLQAQGYGNQTVYLAWRNNSNDQFILHIDNILIDSISGKDAELTTAMEIVDEYWQVPLAYSSPFSLSSVVENVGADTLYNLRTMCDIYRNGQYVQTDSTPTLSFLAPTDSAVQIVLNAFNPSFPGDYHVVYYPRFDGVDSDSSNNFYITDTLTISDSTFARDAGIAQSSVGIGPGIQGELGVLYNINQIDTLTSVSVYIANVNGQMTAQPLSINIRSFTSAPSTIIASSDTIIYNSSNASWVDFSFNSIGGYVPLQAGPFFIGVVERDSNVTLGTTPEIYTPARNYIRFPGGITNGWNTLEAYNLKRALMIRPHFAPVGILVSDKQLSHQIESLAVYPNPSYDGIFNLDLLRSSKDQVEVKVYSLDGKEINGVTEGIANQSLRLDLNGHQKGVYIIRISMGKEMILKKIVYN